MKRGIITGLLVALAIWSGGCAKPNPQDLQSLPQYGFGYCDGSLGSFDVYTIRSPQDYTMFQLVIIPVNLENPGDIVRIDIANQAPAYRELVHETVLQPNQEISAGYLSMTDLQTYTILSISPFDGSGATFLQQTPSTSALCNLPDPGDGTVGGLGYGSPTTQTRDFVRPNARAELPSAVELPQ
jgi:hypothetical protein